MNNERKRKSNNGFFSFSQSERRGFVTLVIILVLVLIMLFLQPFWLKKHSKSDFSEFEKSIAEYEKKILQNDEATQKKYFDDNRPDKSFHKKLTVVPFDPNTLPVEGWVQMGFSFKQAQSLDKYRKQGGVFQSKEDVKKIFFIGEEEYQQLEPYIQISEIKKMQSKHSGKVTKEDFKIEMNTADTMDWKELRGIGSVYAKRIVQYRDELGGFYKKEQLFEVYGFSQALYDRVASSLLLDMDHIRKLNINHASVNDLKRHPYLDYYQAKAIVKYREKNHTFVEVNDLRKISLIDDETFEKVAPYLSVR